MSQDDNSADKDIFSLIRVRFWGNPRPHTFIIPKDFPKLRHRDLLYAKSDRGNAIGMVNSFVFEKKVSEQSYEKIIRMATDEDKSLENEAQKKAQEVKVFCSNEVEKLQLDMTISHVSPIEFGEKMVVYFTAPDRVDFRELVRRLKSEPYEFELRHINPQQKMEALGILGSCGHTSSDYLVTLKKYDKRNFSVNSSFSRV